MEHTIIGKRYAWPRFWAAVIDAVWISIAIQMILGAFGTVSYVNPVNPLYLLSDEGDRYQFFAEFGNYAFLYLFGNIFVSIGFFVLVSFLESRFGATPGKLLCRIQVRDLKGNKLGLVSSLLRNLSKQLALFLLYIPVAVLVWVIFAVSIGILLTGLGGPGSAHSDPTSSGVLFFGAIAVIFLTLLGPLFILFTTINGRGQAWYDRWVEATVVGVDASFDTTPDAFSTLDALQKLSRLKEKGAITTAEFEEQKQKLLHKM
jgi:uncharacterized RDD family membrane protein YckC